MAELVNVITNLSGGLNQSNPENISAAECQACENVDFSAIFGGFVTRKGTVALNTSTLGNPVKSNFKLYKSGNVSHRYNSAGSVQFRNFTSFKASLAAARAYAVGFRDQGFFSDGTNMWVDDGTSSAGYPWGIAAPSGTLAVAAVASPSTQVAYFDGSGTNSETWTSVVGTQSSDTTTKKEGNSALSIVADASTLRGISTRTFAGVQDYSANSGTNVSGQGIMQLWVYVSKATDLVRMTLKVDVGDGSFESNYYTYNSDRATADQQVDRAESVAQYDPTIPYYYMRDVVERQYIPPSPPVNAFPISTNGWTQLSIPITKFIRTGSAPGYGWATVKGLMVAFTASSAITVKFDDWKLLGNKSASLNGTYYWYQTFQHRDSSGNLLNESNPSLISPGLAQQGGAATVTATDTTTNTMVTHRGFYRIGGIMDNAYFVGTTTYAATGTFTDTLSDIGAMQANIALATDNDSAPSGYYYLEGPHFNRIFAGSGNTLRWTKDNMPHSWPSTNTAPLPGAQSGETIQRIIRFANRLFIFTPTGVFEFSGDTEANFEFRRTYSRTGTPAGRSVVNAGDKMIYLGGQGTNVTGLYFHNGVIDRKISFEKLEPFFSGRDASGVDALNAEAVANCQAAYYKNCYWLAYPSGDGTGCDKLLKIDFGHPDSAIPVAIYSYASPAEIASLDVDEVEGVLVAGGADGYVYKLETSATDNGSGIEYSWRSKDFQLGPTFDRAPTMEVNLDMDSNSQGVVVKGYYDTGRSVVVLGTATTTQREWEPVRGETTAVPTRNVSVEVSGTATSEVQIHGLHVSNVRFK